MKFGKLRRVKFTAGVWKDQTGVAEIFLLLNGEVFYYEVKPDSNPKLHLCIKPSELNFLD